MEKRVIIAVVMSIFIIMAFQYFTPKPAYQPAAPEKAAQAAVSPAPETPKAEIGTVPTAKSAVQEKDFDVDTDKYGVTFSNIGGAIKSIRLKEHKDVESGVSLELIDIKNPREYIFSVSDPMNSVNLDLAGYDVSKKDGVVEYSLKTKDLAVLKRYILHKSKYIIELQLFIKNISAEPKDFSYRLIGPSGITEKNAQDARLVEVTAKIDGKSLGFKRPRKDERITNRGLVGWSALKSRYFSMVLKPFTQTEDQFYSESNNGYFVTGVDSVRMTIQPGAFIEHKFLLYAGPNDVAILRSIGEEFEETINYGFFGGISKAMIASMKFLYRIVHNWGVAIILLSVFLNIILFPLTIKSFKSMQKMQELHPQMEKLKAQFKDSPQKLNKEIMELYKKYNINPLSGCLPLILQMPIFIALYQALLKSVELRGAGFLWIKDLSSPDAVRIPMSLPILGNSINILPLIMVAAMVIQQKMSTKSMGAAVTEEQKQQQKMMLVIMPIVFGFIFYSMPSGLVLYWVVNTGLTIFEQAAVLKKT